MEALINKPPINDLDCTHVQFLGWITCHVRALFLCDWPMLVIGLLIEHIGQSKVHILFQSAYENILLINLSCSHEYFLYSLKLRQCQSALSLSLTTVDNRVLQTFVKRNIASQLTASLLDSAVKIIRASARNA